MSTIPLNFDGTRITPLSPKGLMVRLDTREKGIVIWDGGYQDFRVSDIPKSWQAVRTNGGKKLSVRLRRTGGLFGAPQGIEVEFL